MHRSLALLLMFAVSGGANAIAQPPKPANPMRTKISPEVLAGLETHEGLEYARYGDRVLQLDLFKPKNAKQDLPGIVCIHGGGWAKGSRKNHATLAMAIAARGYVAVTISYRLSGEAPFPAAIHDAKAAVRWMRANAKKYGIDQRHIGAIGLSAGGHLVALLGTSNGVKALEGDGGHADALSTIQAAVPMGAQTDLESERVDGVSAMKDRGAIWRQFLGGSQADQPKAYRLASPLTHLDKGDPPMHFITGEKDSPSTRAATFRARMKTLGIASGLTEIPGAPHPFLNRQEWFDRAVDDAVALFDRVLKPEAGE